MNEQEYRQTFKENRAVGWEAVDAALKAFYGGAKPRFYDPIIRYWLGGTDPLNSSDTFGCEEQTFHRHIVSYGMSELYFNPELAGADYSKWGFEFTFRTPPYDRDPDSGYNTKHEPYWTINLVNNLDRYIFENGNWSEAYHFISTNDPIRMDTETAIVGVAFAPDPKLPAIKMSNGEAQFLQMVDLIQPEFDWLRQDPTTKRYQELIDMMRKDNLLLIIDLARIKNYVQP